MNLTSIKIIVMIFVLHSSVFILEYLYQMNCAKLSLYGYFNMIFTNQSQICLNLRNGSYILQQIVCNIIFQTASIMMIIFNNCITKMIEKLADTKELN